MSRLEYEVVKQLEELGYKAVLRIAEKGYMLKVKKDPFSNGKTAIPEAVVQTIEKPEETADIDLKPKVFTTVQKHGYLLMKIGIESFDSGTEATNFQVPYALFVKEYKQIQ